MPARRPTSCGDARSGGNAIPSVKTSAPLPPSSAAQRGCSSAGVNIQPAIAMALIIPATINGQRRPTKCCATNVTPILTGNCAALSDNKAAGVIYDWCSA